MRTIAWLSIGIAACVLWAGCPVWAQKTSYAYGHKDLTGYRTFSFREEPPTGGGSEKSTTYDSRLVDERTKAAVAAELERRGLTRNDDNPDLWVVTRRSYWTEHTISPYPDSWTANGWGWPYGFPVYRYDWAGNGAVEPLEIIRGTLTVDLRDASGRLIWRGVGDRRAHQTSKPSHRTRHVNDEVEDIFANLP